MEEELETVTIDDKDYFILHEVEYNDQVYLYLSNINDEEDTLLRKAKKENKDTVLPLEDENEFEIACNLLLKFLVK